MTQSSIANSVNDVFNTGRRKESKLQCVFIVSSSKYTRKWPVDIRWKMKILLGILGLLHVILGKAITYPKI
jgi:capsular polysaccharide biosynthesis protein